MARPLQHWDLSLRLEPDLEGQAVFVRIARAIADDIRGGRLAKGARLPGSRALASTLAVHRNTVIAAYRELLAEGYLEARSGRGTFVSDALPDVMPRRLRPKNAPTLRPARPALELPARRVPAALYQPIPKGTLALYGGLPDARLVPSAALARAQRHALRHPELLGYGDPRGHERLRQALAIMLSARRGLALGPDDLVITRGSQMALALGAKAALAEGDVVAVEQYGYRPAWEAFSAAGARLLPVAVDQHGLCVDALQALCARQRVRAVYVTPHHQYPTTATLSAPRRLALLELAEREGLLVFEDDYDHEFHYEGRPILPLASADRAGVVVYVGTLSKVLAPGLRVGYMVAPRELLERVVAERFYLDRQGDLATEHALAELFEDGEIQRHVRRTRRLYQTRRDHFVALLGKTFGDALEFRVPNGGMALWAKVTAKWPVDRWLERAADEGVLFHLGRQFDFQGRPLQYVRFGYAGLTEPELSVAVKRLERAQRKLG
jgi:GntR family transcriptional regulator/MocR family aminotransferase